MMDFESIQNKIEGILGIKSYPVAVFLLGPDTNKSLFSKWRELKKHRYCQALMRARSGEKVILDRDEISCPAAASVLGVKPLPPALKKGEGLVGFGIVTAPEIGRVMFEKMPHLEPGSIEAIAFSPLKDSPFSPDIVVIEAEVEKLMWLVLADVNLSGGKRRNGNTAVLQATCVDASVIPYLEKRLNFSFGCYGCREATDLAPGEAVVGFPSNMLKPLAEVLEYLSARAVRRSRAKIVYRNLIEEDENKKKEV